MYYLVEIRTYQLQAEDYVKYNPTTGCYEINLLTILRIWVKPKDDQITTHIDKITQYLTDLYPQYKSRISSVGVIEESQNKPNNFILDLD